MAPRTQKIFATLMFLMILMNTLTMSSIAPILELQIPVTGIMQFVQLRIEAWESNSLRVRLGKKIFYGPGTLGLTPGAYSANSTSLTKSIIGPREITNGNIRANVDTNGLITFTAVDTGKQLLRQFSAASFELSPTTTNLTYMALNMTFESDSKEQIFGLGQRSLTQNHLDNKISTNIIALGQNKYYISVPFYYSSRGYGFLWNMPGDGQVTLNPDATRWYSNTHYQIDFWITTGVKNTKNSAKDVMAQYADATGHTHLLPDHAAGFWQSKCRYKTQNELLEVAEGYSNRSLELGIIVIDFHSWVYFGDYTFNKPCWPSPKNMTAQLLSLGTGDTHVLLSTYPFFDTRSNNTQEGLLNGYFTVNRNGTQSPVVRNNLCENKACYLIDPFLPAAREWVWSKHEHYFDSGIESFWLDDTEPMNTKSLRGVAQFACGPIEHCGALWPNAWVSTFTDGVVSRGVKRPMMLSRAGWAGFQKLGAALWSSDIKSTFKSLQVQVRAGLATAMSGIPYWTTDVGGFSGGKDTDPEMQELIIRWHQYGAFCPIYRTHGNRKPECPSDPDPHSCNFSCGGAGNEAWSYGPSVEIAITRMIEIRTLLKPYTLQLATAASERGEPPMRPMFYDFPMDEKVWNIDDQFMYGPSYLVAPILEYQARSRSVYLPEGKWKHYFSNKTFTGGEKIVVEAPLLSFPLFERIQ